MDEKKSKTKLDLGRFPSSSSRLPHPFPDGGYQPEPGMGALPHQSFGRGRVPLCEKPYFSEGFCPNL